MKEYIITVKDNGMADKIGQEIIRCDKCKYRVKNIVHMDNFHCAKLDTHITTENFFCYYGKADTE